MRKASSIKASMSVSQEGTKKVVSGRISNGTTTIVHKASAKTK